VKYQDDIKKLLEAEHTTAQRNKIVSFIGSNSMKMKALMSFFLDSKWHWRFNQRAAWPVNVIGRKQPKMIKPYLEKMVKVLKNPSHNAVARNTMSIFQEIDIPEHIEGELYERSFEFLRNPKEPIAVRAFSISVLTRIAIKYPDLQGELIAEVEEHLPHGTAAYKSRAKRALALLKDQ